MARRRSTAHREIPRIDGEEDGDEPRARSFWSGTLTFGLVSIPVALYTAYRSLGTSLRTLSPEGKPLVRRYACSKDGTPVDAGAIVRGYELDEDRFVEVTDEELEGLEPKKSRDIALSRFVDVDAIPPMYFERAYFLAPAGGSRRAYHLLAGTMERMKKAGIATFVMRGKEHLIAIFSERGVLIAETMRFADELRSAGDVGVSPSARVPAATVNRFRKLISKHAAKKLDLDELRDEYWEKVRALAEKKYARGKDVVPAEEVSEAEPSDAESNVIDLMEALKRRLAGQPEPGAASRARSRSKSGTRRAPAGRKKTATTGKTRRKPARTPSRRAS